MTERDYRGESRFSPSHYFPSVDNPRIRNGVGISTTCLWDVLEVVGTEVPPVNRPGPVCRHRRQSGHTAPILSAPKADVRSADVECHQLGMKWARENTDQTVGLTRWWVPSTHVSHCRCASGGSHGPPAQCPVLSRR